MFRKIATLIIITIISSMAISCSDANLGYFQFNRPDPNFTLFAMFDDYPSLSAMWDSIDGEVVNDRLGATIRNNEDEFSVAAVALGDLLNGRDEDGNDVAVSQRPLTLLLRDLGFLLAQLMDTEPQYNSTDSLGAFFNDGEDDTGAYLSGFFEFLNNASEEAPGTMPGVGESLAPVLDNVVAYVLEENTEDGDYSDLRDAMETAVSAFTDKDFHEDYVDLIEVLSKALFRCDYNKYVDGSGDLITTSYEDMVAGTNTGVGNLVKGVHAILSGMLKAKEYTGDYEYIDRDSMYDTLIALRDNVLRDPDTGELNTEKLKALILNLEAYFTEGGALYETRDEYNHNDMNGFDSTTTGDWGDYFSSTELRNTLKEVMVGMGGLFMRADRDGAVISETDNTNPASKDTLAEVLARADTGIDWENNKIDESLYDLLRYDLWGRDRLTDSDAYPASFLESFLFLGAVTSNFGYEEGGNTEEIDEGGNTYTNTSYEKVSGQFGHGQYIGTISLADSIHSITSKNDDSAAALFTELGTYQLAFDEYAQSTGYIHANHIYRSMNTFTLSGNSAYTFNYTLDYPALCFTSGFAAGDIGVESGGNPSGGGGDGENEYRPYYPTGQGNMIPSGWTLSTMARTCWEGEGPYYYLGSSPETIEFSVLGESKTWDVAYSPNGQVYAYVDTSSTPYEYFYPVHEGTTEEYDTADALLSIPTQEYISSKDISGGVKVYILGDRIMCITVDKASYTVELPYTTSKSVYYDGLFYNIYTRAEIIAKINDEAGFTLASTYGTGQIRLSAACSFLEIESIQYSAIARIFEDDSYDDTVPLYGGCPLSADSTINVTIDGVMIPVSFAVSSGPWTKQAIATRIQNVLGSSYNKCASIAGSGIRIKGLSNEPDTAQVRLENASGDAMSEFFGLDSAYEAKCPGRKNRYRGTWVSDYYMIVSDDGDAYTPLDLSGEANQAAAMVYDEIITDDDDTRVCENQEEAMYRNYQYFATEKKIVLIVPLWLRGAVGSAVESAVYQIIEGNGWSGVNTCRRLRENGVWAKANHDDAVSTVPGDFRIVILAAPIQLGPLEMGEINAEKVYNETLGRGTANPAVIGMNIPALYRLGFPRQDCETRINGVGDNGKTYNFYQDQLGSSRTAGDSLTSGFIVGDDNWNKRNTLLPALIALFSSLHQVSTEDNHALSKTLDGLTPLLKPLTYYNNSLQNNSRDVATQGWIPRIQGTESDLIYDMGSNADHAAFLVPDTYIDGFKPYGPDDGSSYRNDYTATTDPEAWFGGWDVRDYYQPAHLPTLLSLLVDNDLDGSGNIAGDRSGTKMDGLLPMICEYDVSQARSDTNESVSNLLGKGVNALAGFSDPEYDDPSGIDYTLTMDEFDATTYSQWGPRRKIFYGVEQAMNSLKMAKGVYENINMNNTVKVNDTNSDGKGADTYFPDWMFQSRSDDLDVDKILDSMVGPDQPLEPAESQNTGIAGYPDDDQLQDEEILTHFDILNEDTLTDPYDTIHVVDDELKLIPDDYTTGPVSVPTLEIYAYKSGVNSDARFQINDSTGSLAGADVSSIVSGVTDAIPDGITLYEPADLDGDGDTEMRIYFTLPEALNDYVITCNYQFDRDDNWPSFTTAVEDIDDLFTDFVDRDGGYAIYDPLMDTLDSVLAKNTTGTFDDAQVKGLLYTLGKLFAHFNGGSWTYEGEIGIDDADGDDIDAMDFNKVYRIFAYHLPAIHRYMRDNIAAEGEDAEVYGERYYALLTIVGDALQAGGDTLDEYGLMRFLLATVNTGSYGWEDVFGDLQEFLTSDLVCDDDTDMWDSLADLIADMNEAVSEVDNDTLRGILKKYGFQDNKY